MEIQTHLDPFQPPEGLSIIQADLGSRQLTFTWSPVVPDCPAIHYNILASKLKLWQLPHYHQFNTTTATCTNVPTNGSVCMFAVQSVVYPGDHCWQF